MLIEEVMKFLEDSWIVVIGGVFDWWFIECFWKILYIIRDLLFILLFKSRSECVFLFLVSLKRLI